MNFTVQQVVCHHDTSPKLKLETSVSRVNRLLCHNFTQYVSQPYSKFDTVLFIHIYYVCTLGDTHSTYLLYQIFNAIFLLTMYTCTVYVYIILKVVH